MADVLVTGCFNIVHAGHIRLLALAASFGYVTVGLNGDEYVRNKYGEYAVAFEDRAAVMSAIRHVGDVVGFNQSEPSALIRDLKPKYFFRGPDYANKKLPECVALEEVGAELVIYRGKKDLSVSQILWPNESNR